ncbi:sensor histidine kinase [Indiicoccus explosivorum]|uniref:sensor histidine kinase n=1 Tax=Indiicoccus explosivorum TaxID=1917864 RepID=UPI000B443FA1|nr:sensor histidine kinase [Indiicoccus explosivorum]
MVDMLIKMFENSTDAIFFFDANGKALALNPAAEQIIDKDVVTQLRQGEFQAMCQACRGYTSDTELQTCLSCYFSHNSDPEDFSSFQVYLETEGKGVLPYAATFHTIDPENGVRVFMLRDLTKQFKTQERLYENKMMKHVIEAQENEQKRISRELHDSVAQELLSAVVDLRVVKYMTQDQDVLDKVRQTEATMTRLLDDIRNLSVELRPAALDDFGLEAAFRSHFKRVEQSYGLEVEFKSDIGTRRFGNEIETVVYRICQEAVLNAVKYAQVDSVKVTLTVETQFLKLRVEDKGAGFEKGDDPIGTGLGLHGMRERAELVHGDLTVQTKIGKGTAVQLSIPIGQDRTGGKAK